MVSAPIYHIYSMPPTNGQRHISQEIIDAVKDDPELQPIEKETSLSWARPDDHAQVYSEESGVVRRLLEHPEFITVELRVNTVDAWGRRLAPDEYSGGTVTGAKGYLPIGTLKVKGQSRSTSQHARVVSKAARRGD